ncbi:MAG TPA: hypothetical protein VJ371_12980 [Streptosporangiaceae bacterium]|nr:hypothetical protein [Streptosporangiaceae bacterium]
MSIKSRLVTAATALTVMAGVGAAGTLTANAATSKCGAVCSEFYSATTGTAFVLDVPKQASRVGQPLTLARANRASKGEDFVVQTLGTVRDFHAAGFVSGGLNALYGGLSVYEIEYAPGASPSFLCLGTAGTPGAGTPVTLQPCGMQAKTLWIFAPHKTSTRTYDALISAATSKSFQDPYVLTSLKPGAPLVTAQLVAGTSSAFARQLWSWETGVLPSSSAH